MNHIVYGSSTYVRNQLWPNLFGIIWLKVLYSTDADDDNKSAAQTTKFAKLSIQLNNIQRLFVYPTIII